MKAFGATLFVTVFKLFSLLPLWFLRSLGAVLGRLAWWLQLGSRCVIEENLRLCFPDMAADQRKVLVKQRMQQLGMMALELSYVWHRPIEQLMSNINQVQGVELLRESLAQGQGVVLLAPHIGNWELLGVYLAENFPVTNMYQPPENRAMDKMIYTARMRNGAKLAPTTMGGVKTLLKALKKGEVVGVLPDQTPPVGSGEFAPFFNLPALTATLSCNLIQRTGARVVLAYARRVPAGGFDVVFEAVGNDVYSDDTAISLTAFNNAVEQCVRKIPAQYQWEYKRFRRQPGCEKKYYLKK